MHTPVLTTQTIKLLTVLADEGSFTLAAERLGITQSAVSRTIAQVENALGVTLFTRGRSGTAPTAALKTILPRLRRIQREIEAVTDAVRENASTLSGTLKVAGFRSAVTLLLPPAISAFMLRHPDVKVSLAVVREHGAGVQHVVEQGEADFGLTTIKPPAKLRSTYLGSDRYVLVRRTQGAFSPNNEQLVLWKERCSELVPEILNHQGWNTPVRLEVDTDTAVLAMVSHGAGFTIMPELATEPLPDNLERLPLSRDFRRGIWLCGLPSAWESKAGRSLAAEIRTSTRHTLSAF